MRVRVKLCGLTTPACMRAAVSSGADAVGFVFSQSPRRVTIERARELAVELPPFVATVAVFHHPTPDEVECVLAAFHPHVVQTEPTAAVLRCLDGRARLLPVFHDGEDVVQEVQAFLAERGHRGALLFEAQGRGGRGIAPDRGRAAEIARIAPIVLAGGLRPDNVAGAILSTRPYAVDVSSGIEAQPGVKDPARIEEFMRAVRQTEVLVP